jgi:putative FmdB family regulatory protein
MPLYEYRCLDCDREFSVALHVEDYGQVPVCCPYCEGANVEREIHHLEVLTGRKS